MPITSFHPHHAGPHGGASSEPPTFSRNVGTALRQVNSLIDEAKAQSYAGFGDAAERQVAYVASGVQRLVARGTKASFDESFYIRSQLLESLSTTNTALSGNKLRWSFDQMRKAVEALPIDRLNTNGLIRQLSELVTEAKTCFDAREMAVAHTKIAAIDNKVAQVVEQSCLLTPEQADWIRSELVRSLDVASTKLADSPFSSSFAQMRASAESIASAYSTSLDSSVLTTKQDATQRNLLQRRHSDEPAPRAPLHERMQGVISRSFSHQPPSSLPPRQAVEAGAAGSPPNGRQANAVKLHLPEHTTSINNRLRRELSVVQVDVDGRMVTRSFRLSRISSEGFPPLLVGSAVASGSFGKIVPVVFRNADGQYISAVGKIIRKEAPRNASKKAPRNALGRNRVQVGSDKGFEHEVDLQERLGMRAKVLGTRSYGDKRMVIMTAMDMSLSQAVKLVDDADLSAFVRHSLTQLADHYRNIVHRKSFVHGDGKAQNTLVNLEARSAELADFGGAQQLTAFRRSVDPAFTYLSPEYARNEKVSLPHDIFCLGVTGLELLSRGNFTRSLFIAPRPAQGQVDIARVDKNMAKLEGWRMRVLADSTNGSEVDPTKMRNLLAESSEFRGVFGAAFARDEELTMYILGSLLHSNENQRPAAAQAATRLARLSQTASAEVDAIYDTIKDRSQGMRDAQRKMTLAAPLLL